MRIEPAIPPSITGSGQQSQNHDAGQCQLDGDTQDAFKDEDENYGRDDAAGDVNDLLIH